MGKFVHFRERSVEEGDHGLALYTLPHPWPSFPRAYPVTPNLEDDPFHELPGAVSKRKQQEHHLLTLLFFSHSSSSTSPRRSVLRRSSAPPLTVAKSSSNSTRLFPSSSPPTPPSEPLRTPSPPPQTPSPDRKRRWSVFRRRSSSSILHPPSPPELPPLLSPHIPPTYIPADDDGHPLPPLPPPPVPSPATSTPQRSRRNSSGSPTPLPAHLLANYTPPKRHSSLSHLRGQSEPEMMTRVLSQVREGETEEVEILSQVVDCSREEEDQEQVYEGDDEESSRCDGVSLAEPSLISQSNEPVTTEPQHSVAKADSLPLPLILFAFACAWGPAGPPEMEEDDSEEELDIEYEAVEQQEEEVAAVPEQEGEHLDPLFEGLPRDHELEVLDLVVALTLSDRKKKRKKSQKKRRVVSVDWDQVPDVEVTEEGV